MEGSESQVQTVFNSFDKDGNGYLEREEIKKCAEELGTPFTSDAELDKTMKLLDLNKDGKISFNEFDAWWNSKKSGTEQVLWLKMKSLKLTKRIKAGVEKWGGFQPCDADHVQHTGHFHVGKCTLNEEGWTKHLELSVNGGKPSEEATANLGNFGLTPDTSCWILSLKVTDSAAAKPKFEALVEQAWAVLEAFAPPQAYAMIREAVGLTFATPSLDCLQMCLQTLNPMVNDVKEQYLSMLEQFQLQQESFNMFFGSKYSLNDWLANGDAQPASFLGNGFAFVYDLNVSKTTLNFVKTVCSGLGEQFNGLLPFLNLSGSQWKISYDSLQDLLGGVDAVMRGEARQNLEQVPTLNQGLDLAKEQGGFGASEILDSFPVAKELLDTCNEFLLGSVSLTVVSRVGSVKVSVGVSGVGSVVSTFLKAVQPAE